MRDKRNALSIRRDVVAPEVQRRDVVSLGRVVASPAGLTIPEDVTAEELIQAGRELATLSGYLAVSIADAVNALEDRQYGDLRQIAEMIGVDAVTLRVWCWAMRRVEPYPRGYIYEKHIAPYPERRPLSIGHYKLLAGVEDPHERLRLLEQCAVEQWTIRQLTEQLKQGREEQPSAPDRAELLQALKAASDTLDRTRRLLHNDDDDDPSRSKRINEAVRVLREALTLLEQHRAAHTPTRRLAEKNRG